MVYGVRKKARRQNLVAAVANQNKILDARKRKKLVRKRTMLCAGGNVLLERGSIVTLDDYKKLKEKVLSHDF